jgi:hypothetical protein
LEPLPEAMTRMRHGDCCSSAILAVDFIFLRMSEKKK